MTPCCLLAIEWSLSSVIATILSILALVLAAIAAAKASKPPVPDRVRPFHRFRLVNKSKRRVKVATSTGFGAANGGGGTLFGPVGLTPGDILPGDPPPTPLPNRYFEYLSPTAGPDFVRSVLLKIRADGDASLRDAPYVQSATEVADAPWADLERVEMVLDSVVVEAGKPNYGYEFTVNITRYMPGGSASQLEDITFPLSIPASA